jgi:hypothetical protein
MLIGWEFQMLGYYWLTSIFAPGRPNRLGVSPPPPHLKTKTDPVSETMCFLVI